MNGTWEMLESQGGKGWRESTLSPDVGTAADRSFAGCVAEPVNPALGNLGERITS